MNGRIETERQNEVKKLEDQHITMQQKLDDILQMPTAHGNLSSLLNIDYQPPNQNFDKGLVKGRLVRMIQVKDERYSIALE